MKKRNSIIYWVIFLLILLGLVVYFLLVRSTQTTNIASTPEHTTYVDQQTLDALAPGEYVNFKQNEVATDNVTQIIVKDAAKVKEQIDNDSNIVASKPIAETGSVALTFDSPEATTSFLKEVDGKVANKDIEKDVEFKVSSFNDTYYSQQTNLVQMSMATGWAYLNDTSSTTIAIIDTGVRGTHEDLSGKVLAGYNVLTSSAITANSNSDDHGHGTAMASAAASIANNGKGIVGVAYNSNILPVKSFNSSGTGSSSNIATGIYWAANNGARVLNLSFGSYTYSSAIHDAILYAKNQGCIVIAASGNDDREISFPASDDLTLAVGSVNSNNVRSSFSNYGTGLDIVAPGESIPVALYNSNSTYGSATGTSVSTALVSGLAALSLNWHSGASINENMEYLRYSAKTTTAMSGQRSDAYYGYGVVDYNRLQTLVGDYNYSIVYQNAGTTLSDNDAYNFVLKVRNTGKSTWRTHSVNLGTSNPHDRVPGFLREGDDPSGWSSPNRIVFTQRTVAPNSNATFSFWMQNPGVSPGSYKAYFQPVVDGIGWMADKGIYWNITVPTPPPAYAYSYAAQNSNPTLNQGEAYQFILRVKNTGGTTWTRGKVNLGTSHGQDRISGFLREPTYPNSQSSGWISSNRVRFQQSSVAPGEYASYVFWMKVPSNMPNGSYKEYFQLVADGVSWLQDYGIYWEITVR